MKTALRATSQPVTDSDRRKLEAALLAAFLAIYAARMRESLDRLGLITREATVPSDTVGRLQTLAADRAKKIQDGIGAVIAGTLAALPDDASDQDRASALAQARNETERYNDRTLVRFLVGAVATLALVETYQSVNSTTEGKSVAEVIDWVWERHTDAPADECQEAEDASPASLDELLAIAGDYPPVHENCACSLTPSSASDVIADDTAA